jgi:GNAT superfamily N-acetyltransferase
VFYKADIPAEVSRVTWSRLLDPAEPVYGALAARDGVAIGLAHWLTHRTTWSVSDFCYLNDLFVAPAARRQGVGKQLILYVEAAARAAGCAQLYWLTHETNTTAQRLYNTVANRTGFIHYGKPIATS